MTQTNNNAEDDTKLDRETLVKAAIIALEVEDCIETYAEFDKKKRDAKVRLIYIAL